MKDWYASDERGVLISPDFQGTVFAHFSVIDMTGYRELPPGQPVSFTYATPGQDGCDHSAQYLKPLHANES
ncbi:MAG TPA: cold shock domain-containing protein [Acidimicrobiales bacterium]